MLYKIVQNSWVYFLWLVENCKNWTSVNVLLYITVSIADLCYFCGVLILIDSAVIKLYNIIIMHYYV